MPPVQSDWQLLCSAPSPYPPHKLSKKGEGSDHRLGLMHTPSLSFSPFLYHLSFLGIGSGFWIQCLGSPKDSWDTQGDLNGFLLVKSYGMEASIPKWWVVGSFVVVHCTLAKQACNSVICCINVPCGQEKTKGLLRQELNRCCTQRGGGVHSAENGNFFTICWSCCRQSTCKSHINQCWLPIRHDGFTGPFSGY